MEDRTRELITEFIKENALNQFLFLPVVLTKLFRRTTLFLLEDPVEVGKIIETAVITDFGNGTGRVHQQTSGKPQTDINDIVGKSLPRAQPEEAAERNGRHTYHIRQHIQTDILLIMIGNVLLHLLYSPAIRECFYLGERRTGQHFGIVIPVSYTHLTLPTILRV